MMTIHKNYYSS